MHRVVAIVFLMAVAASPLSAQNVDFGLWAVSPTLQGDNRLEAAEDIEFNFDEEIGWGGTADIFWTPRFSTELGVYGLEAGSSLDIGGILDESLDLGTLNVTPVTLTLRGHFGGERFDVYAGAGGAYAMIDDLDSDDLLLVGVERIEFDDEFTWLANVGASVRITEMIRIGVDAKWVPLEVAGIDSAEAEAVPLDLDPLILSAGLVFRY